MQTELGNRGATRLLVEAKLLTAKARLETFQSQKSIQTQESQPLLENGDILVNGRSVGEKIGTGTVHGIEDGDVLSIALRTNLLFANEIS